MTMRVRRRPPARPAAVSAALAVAGLFAATLAGCGAGSGASDVPTPTSAAPTAGAAGPGGIAGLASALAQASSAASTTPAPTVVAGNPMFFETPSKNIGCVLSTEQVRCDIDKIDGLTPARPPSCEFDYGKGVYLADGPADYTCASDTVLHAGGARILRYGESITAGHFLCTSNTSGLMCRNTATGRGFVLSRQGFAPF